MHMNRRWPRRHVPPPPDQTPEERGEWERHQAAIGCPSCGGCLGDEARQILYPPDGGPTDRDSWVKTCDCPAPFHSSACEVSPF